MREKANARVQSSAYFFKTKERRVLEMRVIENVLDLSDPGLYLINEWRTQPKLFIHVRVPPGISKPKRHTPSCRAVALGLSKALESSNSPARHRG